MPSASPTQREGRERSPPEVTRTEIHLEGPKVSSAILLGPYIRGPGVCMFVCVYVYVCNVCV
jgi:hypothetical protein